MVPRRILVEIWKAKTETPRRRKPYTAIPAPKRGEKRKRQKTRMAAGTETRTKIRKPTGRIRFFLAAAAIRQAWPAAYTIPPAIRFQEIRRSAHAYNKTAAAPKPTRGTSGRVRQQNRRRDRKTKAKSLTSVQSSGFPGKNRYPPSTRQQDRPYNRPYRRRAEKRFLVFKRLGPFMSLMPDLQEGIRKEECCLL